MTNLQVMANNCVIILLNWNSIDYLKRILQLLKDKKNETPLDVLIVDNGSTKDDSVEFLKSSNYRVVYNKQNLGFAGGVNTAIRNLITFEFCDTNLRSILNKDICLLNVDAEPTDYWLDELYITKNKDTRCGLVGSLGNRIASQYQCEGYVSVDTLVPTLTFYCVLISKEVINKIGGLDTRFELGGYEDNDFSLRAHLAGFNCYLSAKSLVHHEPHKVFNLNSLQYSDVDPINKHRFMEKLYYMLYFSRGINCFETMELAKKTGAYISL